VISMTTHLPSGESAPIIQTSSRLGEVLGIACDLSQTGEDPEAFDLALTELGGSLGWSPRTEMELPEDERGIRLRQSITLAFYAGFLGESSRITGMVESLEELQDMALLFSSHADGVRKRKKETTNNETGKKAGM
jgi:hypothetical protein